MHRPALSLILGPLLALAQLPSASPLTPSEHPGVCLKKRVVQTFAPCNYICKDDQDCPFTQKCCFTGYSLGCQEPVHSDRCQLPSMTGPCRARILRYFDCPSLKTCLQFIYGGCQGNSNNFNTKQACERACGKISPNMWSLAL